MYLEKLHQDRGDIMIKTKRIISTLIVGILLCGMANAEHLRYSGYKVGTHQSATISFDLDNGVVSSGSFHLDRECQPGLYLAGGDLSFGGPLSSLSIDGTNYGCGGGTNQEYGNGEMWYDNSYGLVLRVNTNYGTSDFAFGTSRNPL